MKTLPLENAEDMRLADLVKMSENEQGVVVTADGNKHYVFAAVDEFEWEVFSLSRNQEFRAYLQECHERGEREGRVSLAQIERIHQEQLEKEAQAG